MAENIPSKLRSIVYLIALSFILTTLLVIGGIKRYNENLFDTTYKVNIQKINEALLLMTATGVDYFYSPMYVEEDEPLNYDETSGTFLKSHFELKKYCGTDYSECFAKKYKDMNKKNYTPKFNGACAILNNGTSICITPQVSENDITGIMDVNGVYGPNVYGKDLRTFEIKARKTYTRKNEPVGEVIE